MTETKLRRLLKIFFGSKRKKYARKKKKEREIEEIEREINTIKLKNKLKKEQIESERLNLREDALEVEKRKQEYELAKLDRKIDEENDDTMAEQKTISDYEDEKNPLMSAVEGVINALQQGNRGDETETGENRSSAGSTAQESKKIIDGELQ